MRAKNPVLAVCVMLSLVSAARAQDAPRVVTLVPANESCDVDAKATKTLVVTFDAEMGQGRSLCGGGPAMPKVVTARWKDAKTFECTVELEPDHSYSLAINCPAAQNFRSAQGKPVVPLAWTFETLPAKLPDQVAQKARNQKALDALTRTLAASYSYYDLRVKDWAKLTKEHAPALLAAKTDKCWAAAAARMLAPAQDIHMYLRCGESTFATGRRAIDPLVRPALPAQHFKLEPAGTSARYGRGEDGIGYLELTSWGRDADVPAIEKALAELRDTKALVVDVRRNSGGDETLARTIAQWFVEGTKVYAKNRYRTGPGKDAFGKVLDRALTGNTDEQKRYPGKIAVLTSRYVMSSCESFVMMLQQAKGCSVVGQPTYGSSGNPKPHDLGNGVTLVSPSWQDLRLDGTCLEGEGVAPDVAVAVEAKDLATKDPILEKALEILRAR